MSGYKGREKWGFELPNPVVPAGTACVQFQIPDTPEYRRAVSSWVQELGKWYVWEKSGLGDTRAKQAAQLFRDLFAQTLQITDDCEVDVTIPIFDFREDCILYVSTDNEATWQPVPGWETWALACFKGDQGEPGTPGIDGADGLPGAPGEPGADGCSPTVWIDTRPSDSHKILYIDSDCDEINETSLDLTAEMGATPDKYWVCRFARAVGRGVANAILGGELGALPLWDQQTFDAAFLNSFTSLGLFLNPGYHVGFDNMRVELFNEGYQYNADLADALQVPAAVEKAVEDIFWVFTKPEFTLTDMGNYLGRIMNTPEPILTPVQRYVFGFTFSIWTDQYDQFSKWAWAAMANPGEGDCSLFLNNWTQDFQFSDFENTAWEYDFGSGSAFGAQAELFLGAWLLDGYINLPFPTDIFYIYAEATVIGVNGSAQVWFHMGASDLQGTAMLGESIDSSNPVRSYEFTTEALGVTKIRITGQDGLIDGGVTFTRLILRGRGNNPFDSIL